MEKKVVTGKREQHSVSSNDSVELESPPPPKCYGMMRQFYTLLPKDSEKLARRHLSTLSSFEDDNGSTAMEGYVDDELVAMLGEVVDDTTAPKRDEDACESSKALDVDGDKHHTVA